MQYSFPHYLESKRSVDDRALNLRVWLSLKQLIQGRAPGPALRLLEIGCGTGTMLQRLLAEPELLEQTEYTGIDAAGENIAYARQRLPEWADEHGWEWKVIDRRFLLQREKRRVSVQFEQIDLFEFIVLQQGKQSWDGIIAHAFLDLLDVRRVLPRLQSVLVPGGWFYLTLNFDGLTLFEPVLDPVLDKRILAHYHKTMDERGAGDSRTGRKMFGWLAAAGMEILAAGSSDWVVYPQAGKYPADEAYFLHHILYFFEQSLTGRSGLDGQQLAGWLEQRHAQVERGELVYLAHQFDFLAQHLRA